jgi:hypothetical protein
MILQATFNEYAAHPEQAFAGFGKANSICIAQVTTVEITPLYYETVATQEHSRTKNCLYGIGSSPHAWS